MASLFEISRKILKSEDGFVGTGTALLISSIIGAGAAYLGTKGQQEAISEGSEAQERATLEAIRAQLEMYYQNREDIAPWMAAGRESLMKLLGDYDYEGNRPNPEDFGLPADYRAPNEPPRLGTPENALRRGTPDDPLRTGKPVDPQDPLRGAATGPSPGDINIPTDLGDLGDQYPGVDMPVPLPNAPDMPVVDAPTVPFDPSQPTIPTDLTGDGGGGGGGGGDEEGYLNEIKDWQATGDYAGGGILAELRNEISGEGGLFKESPGYQWQLEQGLGAIERGGPGGKLGGSRMKALMEYGQGLAAQDYGNFLNRYITGVVNPQMQLSGMGQLATSGLGNLGQQTGGNIGNMLLMGGQNQANMLMNQANVKAGLYGNLAGLGGNALLGYSLFGNK